MAVSQLVERLDFRNNQYVLMMYQDELVVHNYKIEFTFRWYCSFKSEASSFLRFWVIYIVLCSFQIAKDRL